MKQITLFAMIIASALFILPSCQKVEYNTQTAAINIDSVKAQITMLEDGYAKATNARDVDGVAVYYANDAESLANYEPTRVGIDAIKAGIKREMDSDTSGSTIAFVTTGVWADGKYATETGTMTRTGKDGKVNYTGKYMTLFELRDGKYVAIRDIWNDDAPRTASPMAEATKSE